MTLTSHELIALEEQGATLTESENAVISAIRRIDITDAAQVHAEIAVSQSINAPILSARAEHDILIRNNKAAYDRNEQEIKEIKARHNHQLEAIYAEHKAVIGRLVAIGEQITTVIKVLEITNTELGK